MEMETEIEIEYRDGYTVALGNEIERLKD